jgi:hypothetical protein
VLPALIGESYLFKSSYQIQTFLSKIQNSLSKAFLIKARAARQAPKKADDERERIVIWR